MTRMLTSSTCRIRVRGRGRVRGRVRFGVRVRVRVRVRSRVTGSSGAEEMVKGWNSWNMPPFHVLVSTAGQQR